MWLLHDIWDDKAFAYGDHPGWEQGDGSGVGPMDSNMGPTKQASSPPPPSPHADREPTSDGQTDSQPPDMRSE